MTKTDWAIAKECPTCRAPLVTRDGYYYCSNTGVCPLNEQQQKISMKYVRDRATTIMVARVTAKLTGVQHTHGYECDED